MAVWGTFRRCSATVANRRLDIVQCVDDRVAEKRRRPIFVTIRVPVGSAVAEVDGAREDGALAHTTRVRTFGLYLTRWWFLEGTLPAQLHCRILACCAGGV
jgi:hypothetical protein